MDVVEREKDRLPSRQQLEQQPDGAIAPVALLLHRDVPLPRLRLERGEDGCELHPHTLVEPIEAPRIQRREVVVEGIHEHRERKVSLKLGRVAGEHGVSSRLRPVRELGQKTCLADPRLARQLERRRLPLVESSQEQIE